jgi:2'-5' RNA ligase
MNVFSYDEWSNLNEDGGTHSSSCAMLYLKCSLEELQSQIEEEDIYRGEKDSERSFGLEDKPHVTLLYGLNDKKVNPNEVLDICVSFDYPDIKLHNVSLFKSENYDVLKFDIDCEVLHEVNSELSKLPHKTDFPDYHPHATIAYLKSGAGKKYVEKFSESEMLVQPKKIVYSRPDGEEIERDDIRYIDQNKDDQ